MNMRSKSNYVVIPDKIQALLQQCHIDGLRFLCQCYYKDKAAVLNYDEALNFYLIIAAFLSLAKVQKVLIVCLSSKIKRWYTYLKELQDIEPSVFTAGKVIEEGDSIVICPIEEFKSIQELKYNWPILVADDVDLLVMKKAIFIENVGFKIGLTSLNFMSQHNLKIKWKIIKWINEKIMPFKQFLKLECSSLKNSIENDIEPRWHRLTLSYYEAEDTTMKINIYDEKLEVSRSLSSHSPYQSKISKKRKLAKRSLICPKNTELAVGRNLAGMSQEKMVESSQDYSEELLNVSDVSEDFVLKIEESDSGESNSEKMEESKFVSSLIKFCDGETVNDKAINSNSDSFENVFKKMLS